MGRRASGDPPRVTVVKPSMNARVRIGGRAYWLGKSPGGKVTAEQKARAYQLWNEYLSGVLPRDHEPADPQEPAPGPAAVPRHDGVTVADIGLRYLDHCQRYYRAADGSLTSSVAEVEMALRALYPFADTLASQFGPRAMATVRDALVREGRPRKTCNRIVKTVRRVFKWAAAEELVPTAVWHGLQAVAPLQKGRTDAPELPPKEEVPEPVVRATLPYLPRVVADMVWLQRWTGARPGEVCLVRPCDIDRSGDVWVYTPAHHKLDWREDAQPRQIVIGPEGQKVLLPYLLRSASAYCFSPKDSERQRNQERRAARQSPLTPSQKARRPKAKRVRPPQGRYTTASYRRAIGRAVAIANRERTKAGIGEPIPDWTPNQLRHLRAGEVKEQFGIEESGAVLGHANLRTTEIYANRKLQIAATVARQMG